MPTAPPIAHGPLAVWTSAKLVEELEELVVEDGVGVTVTVWGIVELFIAVAVIWTGWYVITSVPTDWLVRSMIPFLMYS